MIVNSTERSLFAIQINILLINPCCLRLCQVERHFGRLQPGNARTRK